MDLFVEEFIHSLSLNDQGELNAILNNLLFP